MSEDFHPVGFAEPPKASWARCETIRDDNDDEHLAW
jgi:hypothetical protein